MIQIKDKEFELFIPEEEIQREVKALADEINRGYEGKDVLLIAILNGSFMFASDLMKNISIPCAISFVKVASYHGGLGSSGRVDELIGLTTSLAGKHVVIVEDIVDTGVTMDKVITLMKSDYPASLKICSLLFKPDAYKGSNKPEMIGFSIPNKFVVGYGLDYDELGRNLPEIYQLKQD